jgi:predicted nucleic acid-binding Zn ribbon protein
MSAPSPESCRPRGEQGRKVHCVVCREPIQQGAKICIHCSNAQNWTRHLTRWGTLAGAVVGVVSVATAAYSLSRLVPASARISAVPLACERESVRIAFTNLGDKAGLVRAVVLSLRIDGALGERSVLTSTPDGEKAGGDNFVIEPGKTRAIVYRWQTAGAAGSIPVPRVGTHRCMYSVAVETVDFEGASKSIALQCSCPAN